jgi:hypothetical protein
MPPDCHGRPAVCVIPNQEESAVADALVTKFFWHFGILRELHSDQGRKFEFRLLQEVLQRLGMIRTRTTLLHPQSDDMVERYMKTVEEHLRKVVSTRQTDWDRRLPTFLLACSAQPTRPQARRPPAWSSGGNYFCPATCSAPPPVRSSQRPTAWRTSWTGFMTSITHSSIWRWSFTGWRPVPRDSKKESKSVFATRPGQRKSQLSSSHQRKAHTRCTQISSVVDRIQRQTKMMAPYPGATRDEGVLSQELAAAARSAAWLPPPQAASSSDVCVLRAHAAGSFNQLLNCVTRTRNFRLMVEGNGNFSSLLDQIQNRQGDSKSDVQILVKSYTSKNNYISSFQHGSANP